MKLRGIIPTIVAFCALLSACDNSTPTRPIAPDTPSRIVYGRPTGSAFSAVVLVVLDVDGQPTYACTGTLLAPTVVVTAGHCVGEPGEFSGIRVFTESDVQNGNNDFPNPGANAVEATAWHAHPLFTEAQFALHDVGVILSRTRSRCPLPPTDSFPRSIRWTCSSRDAVLNSRPSATARSGAIPRIRPPIISG